MQPRLVDVLEAPSHTQNAVYSCPPCDTRWVYEDAPIDGYFMRLGIDNLESYERTMTLHFASSTLDVPRRRGNSNHFSTTSQSLAHTPFVDPADYAAQRRTVILPGRVGVGEPLSCCTVTLGPHLPSDACSRKISFSRSHDRAKSCRCGLHKLADGPIEK